MPSSATTIRVGFITLGCPKNEVDSAKMSAAVRDSAFQLVDDPECADVVVINTCSFIRDATEESIATVMEYAHRWIPAGEERRLIVAGCMPSRYGADLNQAMAEVDAFLPVGEEGRILELIADLTDSPWEDTGGPNGGGVRLATGPSAYVQISDGCHRRCTYCTIPSIRGDYRSRRLDEIVTEVETLVASGAREIILIGQDISAYGRDLDGADALPEVVRTVAALEGVDWLRLMYVQPDGITDELLEVMAGCPNVVEYLDMPLQHASASVLRRMARNGDAASYLDLIGRIREALPEVALRTTLIAGFPGESRADAKALEDFVGEADFNYLGVFPYSQEDGTVAADYTDQIPSRTRRARAQRLRDRADECGVARVESLVGSTLEVLVEGYDDEEQAIVGRWRGQAPEIDGIVTLDRGETGQIVSALVTGCIGYDLEAKVL